MFKILFQPYPFTQKSWQQSLIQCFFEGLFVALFLIVIQPFGISELKSPNKMLILACYGLVTFCCGILRFGFFRAFLPFFSESKWTIIREIVSILSLILLIATSNYFFSLFVFKQSISFFGFLEMLLMVLTIGVFPTIFGVMLNYIIQLKKYNHPFIVEKTANQTQLLTETPTYTTFIAENEKDVLHLPSKSLFFIESSDNYSTIYFEKEQKLQKEILRSSLVRLESQIAYPNIIRCHRSFIVNLEKVARVTGNAQGYQLHLIDFTLQVPVARKYSEIVTKLKK